ncbi:hypothetical protein MUN81_15380 [Hymenobacter sp. 5317J-9]|uniref:hypothetical protein n=1 Tax=Hymenobacter sp. 5317J-9 TaxID=2932250 RepID=UPI001FD719A7|nr:hypothetical protein [Hymenobacter sp. 5317J-9]UOQ96617.1 hypothetical protein MUN81_15380 [Hymenobacter sp. 5317J-9]
MGEQLEKVISWLEAGEAADYRAGVLLLQEQGGPRGLVGMLLRKDSTSNREKLRYELVKVGCGGRLGEVQEVLNHFAQSVQGAVPALVEPLAEQPAPEVVPDAVRGDVDELTQLMQRVYNQRCQLSNSLADLAPADAPPVVAEILRLQNQYNALSEKRRRLVAGEAVAPEAEPPAADAVLVVDRAELLKQRANLRSNLSKAKKNQAAAKSEAKRSEYAQKVAVLSTELSNLELQLSLPQA